MFLPFLDATPHPRLPPPSPPRALFCSSAFPFRSVRLPPRGPSLTNTCAVCQSGAGGSPGRMPGSAAPRQLNALLKNGTAAPYGALEPVKIGGEHFIGMFHTSDFPLVPLRPSPSPLHYLLTLPHASASPRVPPEPPPPPHHSADPSPNFSGGVRGAETHHTLNVLEEWQRKTQSSPKGERKESVEKKKIESLLLARSSSSSSTSVCRFMGSF